MRFRHAFALILSAGIFACQPDNPPEQPPAPAYQAISLLGDTLVPAPPSDALLEKLAQREQAYGTDTTDLDALIWYGRFLAYAGDYRAAIKLYTLGLKQWPQEPHLLRHRGHRYLSIREFDRAIADFEAAVTTMEESLDYFNKTLHRLNDNLGQLEGMMVRVMRLVDLAESAMSPVAATESVVRGVLNTIRGK